MIMEGSLSKWTNVMKGWQYRWFVLDDNAGLLSYYTTREKMMRGVRRGCVRLRGAVIGIDDEDDSTFTITVDSKTFHFQARDAEEREKWIRCLEDTIYRHAISYRSPSLIRLDTIKSTPTMADFDKKLTEADVYLQLVLEQLNVLELRMESMENDDKLKLEKVWRHAYDMLEQVKHTIVLLQIAKNTAYPVNGTYQPSSTDERSVDVDLPPHVPLPPTDVPETSYSSSEEEDFFDAFEKCEDSSTSSSSIPAAPSFSQSDSQTRSEPEAQEPEPAQEPKTSGEPAFISLVTEQPVVDPYGDMAIISVNAVPHKYLKNDGQVVDYDAMYEDPTESDINLEGQSYVFSQILSQVKIGMDLTRVVLPTFILEQRSLLEMYADYFAHPDMFVSIADMPTERDRMVGVVRWYMCSYHAGRKSSVAKKPYNPILGEVFQCYWNVEDDSPSPDTVDDGPVPWCSRNQLTFVAEQVSHHPPVSAFYAEHFNKKISFNAHVWTKSKFLGLSIGVHNIGRGVVHIIDHDEEYVLTFPNGYGRSIFTVPWIELGGSVTISCQKTGYRAQIEFLTKPFYGNKKHRITCDVFSPNDKKPFLNIAGEWNGVMEAKWSDGRVEQFANVNDLNIIKKIVRPIDQQAENESRKLWKEVTAGLRCNEVDHASKAKIFIEQRQRHEAQIRRESGASWETKLFHKDNDDWIYCKPLAQRLPRTKHDPDS